MYQWVGTAMGIYGRQAAYVQSCNMMNIVILFYIISLLKMIENKNSANPVMQQSEACIRRQTLSAPHYD